MFGLIAFGPDTGVLGLSRASAQFGPDSDQGSIVTDPLAWLSADLSCAELTDQFRARYSPLGPFAGLPESKKEEVRTALDIICSERFAQCGFAGCKNLPESEVVGDRPLVSTAPTAAPTPVTEAPNASMPEPVDFLSLANGRLQSLVSDRARLHDRAIKDAAKAESSSRRGWERITMQQEEARRHARPEQPKPKQRPDGSYPAYDPPPHDNDDPGDYPVPPP